jgi:serine/threonine-protein kinase
MNPETIGRYEIVSELGRGGMATVYKAHDPRFKRDVAIKLLPIELTHDPSFRTRFDREAQVIAGLEHPGIVPVYDYGEENDQPYIVMRFMPGGSLYDRLASNPLSLAEAARVFNRLAPALDYVHSRGIVHRDLKPANILFDQHGNAYLSDFGIARLTESSVALTGSALIGTPAYMSPEQARGEAALDGRSDIYAMGAILFEMLTGKQPYEATTPMGLALKHITEPVPHIRTIKSDLPNECEAVIARAMAKEREQRFHSANDMAAAITTMLDRQEEPPATILETSIMAEPTPPEPVEAEPAGALPAAQAPADALSPQAKPITPPPIQQAFPQAKAAGSEEGSPGVGERYLTPPVAKEGGVTPPATPLRKKPVKPDANRWKAPTCLIIGIGGMVVFACAIGIFFVYNLLRDNWISPALQSVESDKPIPTATTAGKTTELPTIAPSPVPTLGTILFQDDFSDPNSGWGSYQDDNGSIDYYNGNYRIYVNAPDAWYWSTLGEDISNVSLKVTTYKASGPDDNYFGLLCRYQDKDNYYALVISSDGYYGIGKVVGGEWSTLSGDSLLYSEVIHQGRTYNTLRADCIGNLLTLYANDIRLAQGEDSTFTSGDVGMLAGTYSVQGADLLFDDFVISQP